MTTFFLISAQDKPVLVYQSSNIYSTTFLLNHLDKILIKSNIFALNLIIYIREKWMGGIT